jgi:CheY-like chemotaxis protein
MTKHGTILLVANNAEDIELTRKALSEAGATNPLQVVHSAELAIKYLSGQGKFSDRAAHPLPFLVLLDLKMPGEAGFVVLRWLYERPGLRKKFIIIVLSSASPGSEIQLAYELGAQSYLIKPRDYEQLAVTAQRIKEYWIDLNQPPEAGG